MTPPVDPEICRKIYNTIKNSPGLTLSQLGEKVHIKLSLVESHLSSLVVQGIISSAHEQGFIRYYITQSQIQKRDRRTKTTRQQIYHLIQKQPGLHLAKIAEFLNMSSQLAEYHLINLEKNDLICSLKDPHGYYKRFYIKDGDVGIQEKNILALLRQEHHLKIVIHILLNPHIKHKELLEKLQIAGSTLSHHLKRLEEQHIVESISYGKERGYLIRDEKVIVQIITKHQLGRLIEGFKDIWKDLNLI
jgi:predicted transcriptional regulator